jgi:hypothetical protein
MGETLTQPCRVSEEGLRVVKLCPKRIKALWLISIVIEGILEESTG